MPEPGCGTCSVLALMVTRGHTQLAAVPTKSALRLLCCAHTCLLAAHTRDWMWCSPGSLRGRTRWTARASSVLTHAWVLFCSASNHRGRRREGGGHAHTQGCGQSWLVDWTCDPTLAQGLCAISLHQTGPFFLNMLPSLFKPVKLVKCTQLNPISS